MALALGFGFHYVLYDAIGHGRYRILPPLLASQFSIGPVKGEELLLSIYILLTGLHRLRLVGGHARHDFIDTRSLSQCGKPGQRHTYYKLHTCQYAPHRDCERTLLGKPAGQIDDSHFSAVGFFAPLGAVPCGGKRIHACSNPSGL